MHRTRTQMHCAAVRLHAHPLCLCTRILDVRALRLSCSAFTFASHSSLSGVPTDYAAAKLEVFGDVAHPTHFPHVPDFGSMMKWNENYIYLTHKRVDQAVRTAKRRADSDVALHKHAQACTRDGQHSAW